MATLTQVNLNTADRETLEGVLDLGPDLADAVINYRELYGPFKTWDELKSIEGITENVIYELRNRGVTL